jgi:hypothetical protein
VKRKAPVQCRRVFLTDSSRGLLWCFDLSYFVNGHLQPIPGSHMAVRVDEITINYEEDGVLVVKELDKVVLSKGSWSTILFKYQQWEKNKNDYGPERYSIRRYRKIDDEYRQQAKFNISSKDQATKLIDALQVWIKDQE